MRSVAEVLDELVEPSVAEWRPFNVPEEPSVPVPKRRPVESELSATVFAEFELPVSPLPPPEVASCAEELFEALFIFWPFSTPADEKSPAPPRPLSEVELWVERLAELVDSPVSALREAFEDWFQLSLVVLRLASTSLLPAVLPPPKSRLKKPPEKLLFEAELSRPAPFTPFEAVSVTEEFDVLSFIFSESSVPSLASPPVPPTVLSVERLLPCESELVLLVRPKSEELLSVVDELLPSAVERLPARPPLPARAPVPRRLPSVALRSLVVDELLPEPVPLLPLLAASRFELVLEEWPRLLPSKAPAAARSPAPPIREESDELFSLLVAEL